MPKLIYHVATTLDGFIAKADGTAPGFAFEGSHVDAYREQLGAYGAIVMGRGTYEIGYAYGMKPGDKPYGDRPHYIFSQTLQLPEVTNLEVIRTEPLAAIDRIKADAPGDVYLCGGGKFAGFLLANNRIDALRLKVSPIVYGYGIKLFEQFSGLSEFNFDGVHAYDTGVILLDYAR